MAKTGTELMLALEQLPVSHTLVPGVHNTFYDSLGQSKNQTNFSNP